MIIIQSATPDTLKNSRIPAAMLNLPQGELQFKTLTRTYRMKSVNCLKYLPFPICMVIPDIVGAVW